VSAGALPGGEPGDLAQRCAEVEKLAAMGGAEAGEELVRLLADPSWYLRERVVDALGRRDDAAESIRRALREGEWWARASASEVVGRRADAAALPELIRGVEDRNVFLQKSAVRALVAVADRAGIQLVAERLAALEPARRRRVLARVGHQAPHWLQPLEEELGRVPAERVAEEPASPRGDPAAEDAETQALVRFRAWLDGAAGGAKG